MDTLDLILRAARAFDLYIARPALIALARRYRAPA
jgi:hypothetical protein